MAIMGRKKQLVAAIIKNRKVKQKERENEIHKNREKKQISSEEHQKRLDMLNKLGLVSIGDTKEKD